MGRVSESFEHSVPFEDISHAFHDVFDSGRLWDKGSDGLWPGSSFFAQGRLSAYNHNWNVFEKGIHVFRYFVSP